MFYSLLIATCIGQNRVLNSAAATLVSAAFFSVFVQPAVQQLLLFPFFMYISEHISRSSSAVLFSAHLSLTITTVSSSLVGHQKVWDGHCRSPADSGAHLSQLMLMNDS